MSTLTTTDATLITTSSATSGGNITSDGGATITARGVCWSTSSTPTISNTKTSDGTGTGTFSSSISGLSANTTYYLRAYATNSLGTAYGNQISFTTPIGLATISTNTTSSITKSSAISGGNIINDGGTSVTSRGVCWSTSVNPTVSGSKTTDGTGTGTFTSSLTSLTSGTTYYIRAYATNSAGTAYGTQISFTTTIPLSIGQSYQGGIIATIDGTGIHGLILAVQLQSNLGFATWQTAVSLCSNLVLNGYSDWYLPDQGQLDDMFTDLAQKGLGGFGNQFYWSSTQYNSSQAFAYPFFTYSYSGGLLFDMTESYRVCAVRNF